MGFLGKKARGGFIQGYLRLLFMFSLQFFVGDVILEFGDIFYGITCSLQHALSLWLKVL